MRFVRNPKHFKSAILIKKKNTVSLVLEKLRHFKMNKRPLSSLIYMSEGRMRKVPQLQI